MRSVLSAVVAVMMLAMGKAAYPKTSYYSMISTVSVDWELSHC
jgi:hypothetical protein